MFATPKEVVAFRTCDERVPFEEWLDDLNDKKAMARILARWARVRQGNPGDCKPVGEGVSELRVDYGPGYRFISARKAGHWSCCSAPATSERKSEKSGWPNSIGASLKRAIYESR